MKTNNNIEKLPKMEQEGIMKTNDLSSGLMSVNTCYIMLMC